MRSPTCRLLHPPKSARHALRVPPASCATFHSHNPSRHSSIAPVEASTYQGPQRPCTEVTPSLFHLPPFPSCPSPPCDGICCRHTHVLTTVCRKHPASSPTPHLHCSTMELFRDPPCRQHGFRCSCTAVAKPLQTGSEPPGLTMQAEPPLRPAQLKRVPFVPASANEEPPPELALPTRGEMPPPDLPELILPEAPRLPDKPADFVPGAAEFGRDWSGVHPLQEDLPVYQGAEDEPIPELDVPAADAPPGSLVCGLVATASTALLLKSVLHTPSKDPAHPQSTTPALPCRPHEWPAPRCCNFSTCMAGMRIVNRQEQHHRWC